jgi:hypothetical protein
MKLLKKIIETELFNDKKLGGTPIWEQNTANRTFSIWTNLDAARESLLLTSRTRMPCESRLPVNGEKG